MSYALFSVLQLVIVQVKQQASIVVKHRDHFLDLHGVVLVENSKIASVVVSIQNQSLQNAHPAERITAANAIKVAQEAGDGPVFGEDCRLGKAQRLAGEKRAFGDQCTMIEPQVIGYSIWADTGCKLGSQIFRKRIHAKDAAGLVEPEGITLPHPALGILAVGAEFRRGGGKGGATQRTIKRCL